MKYLRKSYWKLFKYPFNSFQFAKIVKETNKKDKKQKKEKFKTRILFPTVFCSATTHCILKCLKKFQHVKKSYISI